MGIFCFKNIKTSERLGEELKNTREKKGIDLTTAASETHISQKYLEAIEQSNFSILPPTYAHRLAYIKKYAKFLELDEKKIADRFSKDEGMENINSNLMVPQQQKLKVPSLFVLVRNLVISIFLILFVFYAFWQIQGVLRPPTLVVYSPSEGFVANTLNILVEGYTDKETHVTVNGQEIMVDEDGRFSSNIDLSKGINTINIVANKKHGKTTSITRNIIVKNH